MKIRKLQLTGYKVFDELELDFTDLEGNTLDTVVLAGVNGSGKTSILDLFYKMLHIPYHSSLSNYQTEPYYEVQKISECSDITLTMELEPLLVEQVKTRLHQDYEYLIQLLHSSLRLIDGRVRPSGSRNAIDQLERLIYRLEGCTNNITLELKRDCNDLTVFLQRLAFIKKIGYFGTNFIQKKSGEVVTNINDYIVNSVTERVLKVRDITSGQVIAETVNKINNMFIGMDVKTKLVDIMTSPIFESFNGKRISTDQISEGEQQLFYRAVYLQRLDLNDSIILIDEPETSLHPTWQRNILKLYQNIGKNNQIIVATHSPHVIASVKPESLFVLYPNAETAKIEPINMAKAHKHTKGVEPNRILQEIMGMEDLRDPETRQRIDEIAELLRLHPEQVDLPENEAKIEKLRNDLGKGDPFIIRMNHQLLLIKRRNLSHEIHS